LYLERADRVLVVRRHENDERLMDARCGAQHIKPVETRHLHVEEDEIRSLGGNGANGLRSIRRFADDLDIRFVGEKSAKSTEREWLVVDDQRANAGVGHQAGIASAASAAA
jgi:hypothetical protein